MTYTKPEMTFLGDASALIEDADPSKSGAVIDNPPLPSDPAYDLDE